MNIEINIPDAKKGDWEIETFEVSQDEADRFNLIEDINPHRGRRYIKPGVYKRLLRNNKTVMTNTPAEIRDHLQFIQNARVLGGDILINGLGLGVALSAILQSEKVESVTVVEISQDVIDLVGPYFTDSRVNIIGDDAFSWKSPKNKAYNVVWHDVWDNICRDNLKEMSKLHRRYGKKAYWQGSWCKDECKLHY